MDALFFLRLRLRGTKRTVVDRLRAEPLSALLVLGALGVAAAGVRDASRTGDGRLAVAGLTLGLLAVVHSRREDERFLQLAGLSPRRVYLPEYGVLSLPSTLLLFAVGDPRAAAVTLAGALLLPWLPAGRLRAGRPRRPSRPLFRVPVPATEFEWIYGLRRYGAGVGVLYGAALLLSGFPAALAAVLLALTWLTTAFHEEGESWALVEVFGLGAAAFLRRKLGRSLLLLWVLCAPVALLSLVRHPGLWGLPVLMLAACSVVHAGSILGKYALYREGERAAVFGPLTTLFLTAMLLLPPVALFLLYRLWRQSRRRLGHYLDAYA